MQCGSCERIIGKVVERNGARLEAVDANAGYVEFYSEDSQLPAIKQQLAEKGFAERTGNGEEPRGNPERIFKYVSSIVRAEKGAEAEAVLINHSIIAAMAAGTASAAMYWLLIAPRPNAGAYIPLLALSVFTAVATTFAYAHAKCYSEGISCTNGMMVGMVMGMIPGFMAGAIMGATNGMTVGSLAGMAFGIGLGIKAGKCCGAMGAMEGMMAGMMAGLMGAMTGVMALNDNLLLLLYAMFAVSGATLFGMSYLLNREMGQREALHVKTTALKFAYMAVLIVVLFVIMILYGPKGPVVYP